MDESGDPVFYAKNKRRKQLAKGASGYLLMGAVRVVDPQIARKKIRKLWRKISEDPVLSQINSFKKSKGIFHACKDHTQKIVPLFFELLQEIDFDYSVFMVQKNIENFVTKYNSNEDLFYQSVVTKLFKKIDHNFDRVVFSQRKQRQQQNLFESALRKAYKRLEEFEPPIVEVKPASQDLCLCIVDYMNWAMKRAYCDKNFAYIKPLNSKVKSFQQQFSFKIDF